MSSQVQAQPGGNSTQVQAKTDSTVSTDSLVSKAWSKVCKFVHWRFQPKKIVSDKDSESFDRATSFEKARLLSNEEWIPYAILGTIEHAKRIFEGKDSVATNLFGIGRQVAIATDGKFTRGIPQLLEQFTSEKRDWGKIGEGVGYILKGFGCRLFRPFIGVCQYGVSAGTTILTAVKDKFFSSSDTHYTYKKAYNDLKESFKIIGAAIDVSPIGVGGGALYYGIKGSLMMIETYLRKLFNLEFNDQEENNIYHNETLRTWRYASGAIAPFLSAGLTGLYMAFPQLAVVGGNANFIIGGIANIISNILIFGFKMQDALDQLDDKSQQPQQPQQPIRHALTINDTPLPEVELCESQSVRQSLLLHSATLIPGVESGKLQPVQQLGSTALASTPTEEEIDKPQTKSIVSSPSLSINNISSLEVESGEL
jgi:hypothetical protein